MAKNCRIFPVRTHLRSLMFMEDTLERKFYMEMCRIEHWDTRTLDEKIDSQLYQRTAISQRPEEVIKRELDELRNASELLRRSSVCEKIIFCINLIFMLGQI